MMKNKQKFPPDWSYKQLNQLARTSSGGTPKSDNPDFYINGQIPWVTSGDVRKGKIATFNNYITQEGLDSSSAKIFPPNTVLVAMYGATAGQIGILEKEASTNQAVCGILPNTNYSSLFLYHYFCRQTMNLLRMGSGAAQPNISQEIIKNLDILLPPLPEQNRIVAVLETWDKAIEKLKVVIEKKKQVKKQLTKELLSGKRRLAGYSSKWNTKEFKDLATLGKDRVNPKKDEKKYFCLELEHLDQVTGKIIGNSTTTDTLSIKTAFSKGDVLFGKLRAYLRKYWLADRDGACSTEIWVFRATKEIIPEYLFQIVQTDKFIYSTTLSQGTHMPRSSWEVVSSQEINIPSIGGQNAIVKILTSADKEIDLLNKKLMLLQDQKKYLLNNLITGNILTPETLV